MASRSMIFLLILSPNHVSAGEILLDTTYFEHSVLNCSSFLLLSLVPKLLFLLYIAAVSEEDMK